MSIKSDDFHADTVDEQIDHIVLMERTPEDGSTTSVIHNLQDLYTQVDSPEQVRRSLDSIWSRLSDQLSPAHQTLVEHFDQEDSGGLSLSDPPSHALLDRLSTQPSTPVSESVPTGPITPLPLSRERKKRRGGNLIFALMAAVLLLGLFSWTLVTHLSPTFNHQTGSGPLSGTPLPTSTPVTPAPQDIRDQVQQLLQQYHQEVTAWNASHQYSDPMLDGQTFDMAYAYGQNGAGKLLDDTVHQAVSDDDFHAALSLIQNELQHFHLMQTNFADQTPWNQPHATDQSLLKDDALESGTVLVVSLSEQTLRVYQDGQLINAFRITSGRYESPTIPGSWKVFSHAQNVTLKSAYPKDSPLWFPDTNVKYFLAYQQGGYALVDSWWRGSYGPGTNFPHQDAGENTIANNGSSGSLDLSESDMTWLYAHTAIDTPVVIY